MQQDSSSPAQAQRIAANNRCLQLMAEPVVIQTFLHMQDYCQAFASRLVELQQDSSRCSPALTRLRTLVLEWHQLMVCLILGMPTRMRKLGTDPMQKITSTPSDFYLNATVRKHILHGYLQLGLWTQHSISSSYKGDAWNQMLHEKVEPVTAATCGPCPHISESDGPVRYSTACIPCSFCVPRTCTQL